MFQPLIATLIAGLAATAPHAAPGAAAAKAGTASASQQARAPLSSAEQLAADVQKTYDQTTDFSADFHQKFHFTVLRRVEESKGKVAFKKPGRMRWTYTEPSDKEFIIDGSTLWMVQPRDGMVMKNPCFKNDGLTASVAFLWGDGKLLEQFDVSWFSGVFGEKTDKHLALVPKTENGVFAKLILVVDPKTKRIKQTVVVDLSGNVNQFIFENVAYNTKVKDDTFTYTPKPGEKVSPMPGACRS